MPNVMRLTAVILPLIFAAGTALTETEIVEPAQRADWPMNAEPPPMRAQMNTDIREVRNYPEQPPVIPHAIEGYQLTANSTVPVLPRARPHRREPGADDLGHPLHGRARASCSPTSRPAGTSAPSATCRSIPPTRSSRTRSSTSTRCSAARSSRTPARTAEEGAMWTFLRRLWTAIRSTQQLLFAWDF